MRICVGGGVLFRGRNESHCTEGERQSLGNMNNIAIKATEQKQVDNINTGERNQLVAFFYPMNIAYSLEIGMNCRRMKGKTIFCHSLEYANVLRHFSVCSHSLLLCSVLMIIMEVN